MSTTWKATLAIAAVTLLAGVLRFADLGRPDRKYFDEVYYASDGCLYAGIDFRRCGLEENSERSWVHPPLGKALIAVGIDPPGPVSGFGNTPLGWRVSAAAAGTATVGLVAVLGFLLLGRALWAGVAGVLLATESLHFVQSRIAMLDVFLTLFVVLGFVFLVADRVRHRARASGTEPSEPDDGPAKAERPALGGVRPLRLLAGASFGAAVAVKWSGIFALLGAAGLSAAWSVVAAMALRRDRSVEPRAARGVFLAEAAGQLVAFALVPAAVYMVAWLPWLADRGFSLTGWFDHHLAMWDYHATLETIEDGEPIHPYMSQAWTWFLLARPVAYFWRGDPSCCAEILGIGHPLLFWGALLVLPYLLLVWISRREWRAGAMAVPVLAQYLPWLFVARPLFLFYMTPVTPFLALGLAFLLRDLARVRFPGRRTAAVAAAVVVTISIGVFAFFWPVLAGRTITYGSWQERMWVSDADGTFNWV